MSETKLSNRILRRFVETVGLELGADQFNAMLALAKLPAEWSKPETFAKTDPVESAKTYAALQAAMRTYYGRGARGVPPAASAGRLRCTGDGRTVAWLNWSSK